MKCLYDQKEFTPVNARSKFCSDKCRVYFNRNKKSEKEPKNVTITDEVLRKTGIVTDDKLAKINKLLNDKGLPSLVRASELPKTEYISTGIEELDRLCKGFPKQRITEIFGLKGVGKSQLMTRIIEGNPELSIFYVDAENAIKQEQLSSPNPNLEFLHEFILERVAEGVEIALQADYDLIVIDSVAALTPFAELEGETGDANMGLKARLMSQWMRRINYWLFKSPVTAVVFINQQREAIGAYGHIKFTPGGLALGYAASLRLELRSNKADKKEKYQLVEAIIDKSRFSKPYEKTQFKLNY